MFKRLVNWFKQKFHEHDWEYTGSRNFTTFDAWYYKCKTCSETKVNTIDKTQKQLMGEILAELKRKR